MARKKVNFISQLNKLGNKDLSGNNNYPSKQQINFITAEKKVIPRFYKIMVIPVIIIFIIITKFFVYDLIRETYTAKHEYIAMQENINRLKSIDRQNKHVKEEYNRYGDGCLNNEEKKLVNRLDIFEVIREDIQPYAKLNEIDITGNTANITIDKTSLKSISTIVSKVESDEKVLFVTVSTAGTEKTQKSITGTITIIFKDRRGK